MMRSTAHCELAATGGQAPWPILAAIVLIIVGAVILFCARRKNLRSAGAAMVMIAALLALSPSAPAAYATGPGCPSGVPTPAATPVPSADTTPSPSPSAACVPGFDFQVQESDDFDSFLTIPAAEWQRYLAAGGTQPVLTSNIAYASALGTAFFDPASVETPFTYPERTVGQEEVVSSGSGDFRLFISGKLGFDLRNQVDADASAYFDRSRTDGASGGTWSRTITRVTTIEFSYDTGCDGRTSFESTITVEYPASTSWQATVDPAPPES